MPLTNKNIVLDIDQTLVISYEYLNEIKDIDLSDKEIASRLRIIVVSDKPMYVFIRPYCRDFLRFCFNYFDKVIVWSAGTSNYVNAVVNILFNEISEPDRVFARDFCEYKGNNPNKPLEKITKEIPSVNLSNTLILDDSAYNFINNPDNGVLIPSYSQENKCDNQLLKFVQWLMKKTTMTSTDVRKLEKSQIFNNVLPEYCYARAILTKKAPVK